MKKLLLAFLFLTGLASAQIFSTAASSIRHGAMLPATCRDSQVFFVDNTGAYQCIAGVWQAIPTSVSGTGTVTSAVIAGTANKISVSGTCTITTTGTCTITIPDGVVLVDPALGTPASGVLTNATGLPISTGVSGLGTGVATFLATPSGANLAAALTSALPITDGGTGAATQQAAFDALAPTATRAGDITYWNGTHYVNLAGNNVDTKVLQEDAFGAPSWATPGTVTSVAQSFTGGLISVAGSPITANGTFALTVAGTSGGIPYFSGATTWASSGALTAHGVVVGGGAGTAPTSTAAGTIGQVLTSNGSGADPTYQDAGAGTVTVVGAGTLTSTALVTGGGAQALQTPAATATMDSSGNISTPGSVSTGVGAATAGYFQCTEGTAHTADTNSSGFQCPTDVTSAFMFTLPAAPAAGLLHATNATPSVLSVSAVVNADITTGTIAPNKMAASTFDAQTDGATVTWAIGSVLNANATLLFTTHGGNRTLNITNPVIGGNYVLRLTQDGTGGEGLILGTGCTWKVINGGSGAVTLSTGAGAIDVLAFTYDGTNCLANLGKNYN